MIICSPQCLKEEERSRKAQRRIERSKRILELKKERLRTKSSLFRHLPRMRNPRLIIAIQQFLAIRDRGGRNRIRDWRPHGTREEDPCDRGPPGVRDHAL